jgi:hypothetical protein
MKLYIGYLLIKLGKLLCQPGGFLISLGMKLSRRCK